MIDGLKFTSKIDSVSLWNLEKKFPKLVGLSEGGDYDIENKDFVVNWSLEIESREWGVKSMSCVITDIRGQFDIVYFDEQGNEKECETVEFKPDEFRENWSMEGFQGMVFGSISAETLDINYSDMSVEVS